MVHLFAISNGFNTSNTSNNLWKRHSLKLTHRPNPVTGNDEARNGYSYLARLKYEYMQHLMVQTRHTL